MNYVLRVALSASIGGFLMGFDASVISGTISYISQEFSLSTLQVGWVVASLALTSTLAMFLAGPLSNAYGRRRILFGAGVLYLLSALGSAFAPTYEWLVAARMLGGLGVGAALIVAPMFIAEIAPPNRRGRLVSLNQLNIVLGISVAFFSNYLLLGLAGSEAAWVSDWHLEANVWRWMLGVEALPALLFIAVLFTVPESPRWLVMQDRRLEAASILHRVDRTEQSDQLLEEIDASLVGDQVRNNLLDLLDPRLRKVLGIGLILAILQQITGINAVFFYAPMIFEQSGMGTDAAFLQAVMVGLVNLAFTVIAILFIDRLGRRPLLIAGVAGIVVSMTMIAWAFYVASYELTLEQINRLGLLELSSLAGQSFDSDVAFKSAVIGQLGEQTWLSHQAALLQTAMQANTSLILIGILAFVASFAVSVGPVMWVMFSELFPNWIRGLAISAVGLVNSAVSFGVQFLFPWQLETFGSAFTFLLFAVYACIGLLLVVRFVPETRGQTLEQLEVSLAK